MNLQTEVDAVQFKRVTLFSGHYGSGKTNIAINYALYMKSIGLNVVVADLDIVNPYFRTKDSQSELEQLGIHLIVSKYANSAVDFPAIPQEMYSVVDDRSKYAVMDIGGDDRGALALGRYAPAIVEENNFENLFVANMYRPLTRTANEALEVLHEVECAGGIKITGIVNNSNLGEETDDQTVLDSLDFINELSEMSNLPIKFTSVKANIASSLEGKIDNILPMKLQKKII